MSCGAQAGYAVQYLIDVDILVAAVHVLASLPLPLIVGRSAPVLLLLALPLLLLPLALTLLHLFLLHLLLAGLSLLSAQLVLKSLNLDLTLLMQLLL